MFWALIAEEAINARVSNIDLLNFIRVLVLESYFHTGSKANAIVLALSGVFFSALVVAQRLVEQVGSFGVDSGLEFLAEGVTGVDVHIVDRIVVAIVELRAAHFVDERRCIVLAQADIEAPFIEE